MSTKIHAPDIPEDLAAADDTTWMGVHVLSTACFCRRAALIAFERGPNDTGHDVDDAPPLDYLPNFDVQEIEQGLEEAWSDVWLALLGAILTFVLATVLGMKVDPRF